MLGARCCRTSDGTTKSNPEIREIQSLQLRRPYRGSVFSELVSLLVAGYLSEFFLGYSRSKPLQTFKNLCNILCIHDFSLWLSDQSLDFNETFTIQVITC